MTIGDTLRRAALGWLRVEGALERGRAAAQAAAGAFFGAALSDEEKAAVSIAVYHRRARGPASASGDRPLAGWEEDWLGRRLPAAPARVLVGAAGEGREARWLLARGYAVDAFEPAEAACARLRAVPGIGRVWAARYEELDRALAPGEVWDALLIGWGSLSHVHSAAARSRVLAALAARVPDGPLLASFLPLPEQPFGRAARLGARAGGALGRARRLPPSGPALFQPWFGFAEPVPPSELEAVARALGRRLLVETDATSYPHVTLVR